MEVRDAIPDDYDAYVRLFAELGVDDPIPSRERFAGDLLPRVLIAEDAGDVVGYSLIEQMADNGYIRNVVSDPAFRRRGAGVALMEAMRRRFVAAGARTWCLNVKSDNGPAIALYERSGLATEYRTALLRFAPEVELPAPPPGLVFSMAAPEEDAEIEATFALLAGQLASARQKPGRELVQVHRDGVREGIGVFMPSVPGAFPFRLRDPALGLPVAAYLRTRAEPGKPWIQFGVEDHPALCEVMRAAGATTKFEMLHMSGALATS
jgi:GNAT superfamily N-acetyltransferase